MKHEITKVYKLSLALPIILPVIAALPLVFVNDNSPEPFGFLSGIMAATIFSGLVGGVPYLMLVGLLLWRMHRKTERQIRRLLILSPILLLPIFLIHITVFSLVTSGVQATLESFGEVLMFYVPYVLGFGYFYVALVFGTVFLLRRIGVVYK